MVAYLMILLLDVMQVSTVFLWGLQAFITAHTPRHDRNHQKNSPLNLPVKLSSVPLYWCLPVHQSMPRCQSEKSCTLIIHGHINGQIFKGVVINQQALYLTAIASTIEQEFVGLNHLDLVRCL